MRMSQASHNLISQLLYYRPLCNCCRWELARIGLTPLDPCSGLNPSHIPPRTRGAAERITQSIKTGSILELTCTVCHRFVDQFYTARCACKSSSCHPEAWGWAIPRHIQLNWVDHGKRRVLRPYCHPWWNMSPCWFFRSRRHKQSWRDIVQLSWVEETNVVTFKREATCFFDAQERLECNHS